MASDWITTREAAEVSGYHTEHLRELLRERRIQGQKWGREWQVSRKSLSAYLRTIKATGEKRGRKPKFDVVARPFGHRLTLRHAQD